MKRLKAFLSGVCLLSAMFVLTSCNNANTENKSNSIENSESEENVLQKAEKLFYNLHEDDDVDPDCVYISRDGSCLKVDTNPNDVEDGSSNIIEMFAYMLINSYLELPDSLNEFMGETSAMDGRQTKTYDNITVSWKYHPDKGLEAIYELTE